MLANNYQKTAVNKIDNKVVKDRILRQMNDVLMSGSAKNGKLKPLFGQVDEIAIDTTTGRPFKTGAGVLKDLDKIFMYTKFHSHPELNLLRYGCLKFGAFHLFSSQRSP